MTSSSLRGTDRAPQFPTQFCGTSEQSGEPDPIDPGGTPQARREQGPGNQGSGQVSRGAGKIAQALTALAERETQTQTELDGMKEELA